MKRCCHNCFSWCIGKYTDRQFPPKDSSLGEVTGDSANDSEAGHYKGNCKWIRGGEFPAQDGQRDSEEGLDLFQNGVNPTDVCQGALGDCWLLAAMACLAEHKYAIESLFVTKERHDRGKYQIRLYDGLAEDWRVITIDDYIPCDEEKYENHGICDPLFSAPRSELWVMLLEKAFAKLCGNYAALEGGHTIWAMQAMTGDPARVFLKTESQTWERFDMEHERDPNDRRACEFYAAEEEIGNKKMFEILRRYYNLGSVLCASGAKASARHNNGLHEGHAYSILQVKKVNTSFLGRISGISQISGMSGVFGAEEDVFRMVQIRNPWGEGEWTGDWSDTSPLWDEHPKVKRALDFKNQDDGKFWMSWEDFVEHWERIGIVHRTIDIKTLSIRVGEANDCGPAAACCVGCAKFWCLCRGPKHLYRPEHSSDETIGVSNGCCDCFSSSRDSE